MGKAEVYYTPVQLAAIQKMVGYTPEQHAALQKVGATYTPEQLAAMQKVVAKHSPEELAKLDKMSQRIDRALAIRDGLIPPPWMEQFKLEPEPPLTETPEPASEPESQAAPESKPKKKRKHYWDDDVDRVLREEFPDNSATNLDAGDVVEKVHEVLDLKIKESGRTIPRSLILRKTGHWKT